MHPKGAVGEFTTASEVVEDRVDPVVVALAGHDPRDVRREQLAQWRALPAGIELVLRFVELVEEGCRSSSVQWFRLGGSGQRRQPLLACGVLMHP